MQKWIISLAVLSSVALAGDFAHVSDPDRYVNVRSAPDKESSVLETAKEGQCVEMFGSTDGWTQVAVFKDNSYVLGYIRGSRLVKDAKCQGKTIEAQFGKCAVSIVKANEVHGMKDLVQWFSEYGSCNESDAQLTLAEFTTKAFANNFNKALVEMESKSDAFKTFVKDLLAKSPMVKALQKISKTDCAKTENSKLCQEVAAVAQKAAP